MPFPAIELPGAPGPPFHLEVISGAPFQTHPLKPLEAHPSLAAGLEKGLLGCKEFGKCLERKPFAGAALRGIQETFPDIIPVAGKELLHTVTGYQIDTHAA
jgi:hypothetical protein